MEILCLRTYFPKEEFINQAARAFFSGKVVAYPTDSIYGMGCLADDVSAVERICYLKDRDPLKAMIVLMSDMDMVEQFCVLSSEQKDYLSALWVRGDPNVLIEGGTCPTTVILEAKKNISPIITAGDGSLAVRIPLGLGKYSLPLAGEPPLLTPDNPHRAGLPNKDFLSKLLKRLKKPVVSTSLNLSGQEPIVQIDCDDVILGKKMQLDLAVAAGTALETRPSRLIDIRDINNIKVLRS